MTAPYVVSVAAGIQNYGLAAYTFTLPTNRQIDDLIVIHIVMNGAAAVPANWTIKYNADNANAVIYARVDGTIIPAGSAAATVAVTNGGGALHYDWESALIRGAVASGDPFDTFMAANYGGGPTSWGFIRTSTGPDRLMLLIVSNLYSTTPVGVTAPLVTFNNVNASGHVASAPQAVAGATGSMYFTYDATRSTWGMFGHIKPANEVTPIRGGTEGLTVPHLIVDHPKMPDDPGRSIMVDRARQSLK